MNSYSDACSVLVTNHIESIQKAIQEAFVEKDLCDRTGFCHNSKVDDYIIYLFLIYRWVVQCFIRFFHFLH